MCCVLDHLELMEGFVREAEKKRVTVIYAGGDKAVNKDGSGVGGKGGVESIYVA